MNKPNPFEGKQALLDDLLRFMEAKGVNAPMLAAWAWAHDLAEAAKEDNKSGATEPDDIGTMDALSYAEMEKDAILDDGGRDFVIEVYEDVLLAAEALTGRKRSE